MKIIKGYEWSTHIPLLKAAVEVLKPKLITELGVGLHSTPIFLNSEAEKIFLIDNDYSWLEHLKSHSKFDSRCTAIFHDLGRIKISTFLKELSEQEKNNIIDYYKNFAESITEYKGPKLLFVDNFTCARTLAINNMFNSFDMIIYHDCQPLATSWYEYYFEDKVSLDYSLLYLTSPDAWTGCFVKKALGLEEQLKENIQPYILTFCKENNLDIGTMNIIR